MRFSKKFLSIIGCGAVFAGIVAVIVVPSVIFTHTRHRDSNKNKKVISSLQKFTSNNPLNIRYVVDQDYTSQRVKLETFDSLRDKYPKVFRNFSNKDFDNFHLFGKLTPGKVNLIKVLYDGTPVSIFVHEQKWNVPDVIRQWSYYGRRGYDDYEAFLKVKYLGGCMNSSDPKVSTVLRQAMVKQDKSKTITKKIAAKIKFQDRFCPGQTKPKSIITFIQQQQPIDTYVRQACNPPPPRRL